MRRFKKPTHPVVELFSDGEILDVNMLNRRGAFSASMEFPLRRLRTFPNHIELRWPNLDKPATVILVERTRMHFGNTRPWLVCYKCSRRCAILYVSTIDVACRRCAGLKWACQRQRRKTRLKAKAEKIRNRLWRDGEKIIRPRGMHKETYRKHLHKLQLLQHAISTGSRLRSARSYHRLRERDEDGKYCN
jgi:hypothetical protein